MELPKELYHYTLTKNVESILKEGLVPGKGESEYFPIIADYEAIWLDSFYHSPPSKNCSILAIDTSKLDTSKLKESGLSSEWYRHIGVIPNNSIELAEIG